MPRVAFDYSKTEIYKIICADPEIILCYVGHTTNFIQRQRQHKCNANRNKELDLYTTINANGGWGKFNMVFVEKFECANKREALAREQYWIDELNPNMNSIMAQRSKKEYHEDNREAILEHQKEYRNNNKEKIQEYYQDNKYHLQEYMKEYYQDNKEKIQERYQNNKELIAEQMSKPFECACGSTVRWGEKARHFRTKNHILNT